ncbi:MAG: hypothetical protein P8J87_00785 [Verrucomicrobiales bacterium]|nr:hypothetical protein [Verrucomicrobiales bacterium]
MSDGSPREPGRGAGLVFNWNREGVGPRIKLAGFVIISVVLHTGFFYLFRVVYPASERVLPTPVRVLLLAEESPGVRPLLRALDDRDAAYRSSVRESVSGSLDLGTFTTVYGEGQKGLVELGYLPSYMDYEPEMQTWPDAARDNDLPALSESGVIPVVPLSREEVLAGDGEAVVMERAGRVSVIPGGALEGRKIVSIPETDPSEWSGSGNGRVVFMVGIERAGRAVYRLPSDRGGLPDVSNVSRFVAQIVFEPGEAGDPRVEWGMVELVW